MDELRRAAGARRDARPAYRRLVRGCALALGMLGAGGAMAQSTPAQPVPLPVPHGTLADERGQVRLTEDDRRGLGIEDADALPPLRDRADAEHPMLVASGFRVHGVGAHADAGITPDTMQALADARFRALAGGDGPARLDFGQLQSVADEITVAYRRAGFIVSRAYLPAQEIGDDGVVRIDVLEGRLGQVTVEGASRYRPSVLSASTRRLEGRVVRRDELEPALLHLRDLPGVSASPVLQPGRNPGETDLVIAASEEARPFGVSMAGNNYGTDVTGRYRAQIGLAWRNALGLGDVFTASYTHAFDPQQSQFASLAYAVPVHAVDGLGLSAGYTRSEMEVGGALPLSGPTSIAFVGTDWKFLNREHLQMQASLRLLRERSDLSLSGLQLSAQRFDVVEAGYTLRHVDRRWRGVNLVQAQVRQAVDDASMDPDLVTFDRDSHFTLLRLSLARMQYLSRSQRLYGRFYGQYSEDVLVPMEQISLGGPDSIRALAVSEALGDRGYQATLEYQVDAPGFGDRASPFGGRPWRDLLQFDVFVDHGRVLGAPERRGGRGATYHGAGTGLTFRLPHHHGFELRLMAATPVGGTRPNDDDVRVWARLGLTF